MGGFIGIIIPFINSLGYIITLPTRETYIIIIIYLYAILYIFTRIKIHNVQYMNIVLIMFYMIIIISNDIIIIIYNIIV